MAWRLLVELVGELFDLGEPRLDAASFFSPNATCARRRFELLEHLLGADELIFGRLNLADGVALSALHPIELGEQLVLDSRRSRQFLRQ